MEVAPPEVKSLKDTTGAGDAYLGGMIVGLVHDGLPKTREELRSALLTLTFSLSFLVVVV